jgi:hypothetical protein
LAGAAAEVEDDVVGAECEGLLQGVEDLRRNFA